jgi:hypothetical protein
LKIFDIKSKSARIEKIINRCGYQQSSDKIRAKAYFRL